MPRVIYLFVNRKHDPFPDNLIYLKGSWIKRVVSTLAVV